MVSAKKTAVVFLIFQLMFLQTTIVARADDTEIKAPSAVLMDGLTGKILFEKNSHDKRPCASLTKIMTLYLIFEAIENGKITAQDMLVAGDYVSSVEGAHVWIKPGESLSVNDLIKSIAVASANDASLVLAYNLCGSEKKFVLQMQEKAREIGMKDTTFKNCNGIEQEGHVSSAHDIALLSKKILQYKEVFDYTSIWMDSIREGKTQIVNTNKMLKNYNGTTGLKTGTTDEAGSCIAASVTRENFTLVAVVLGCKTGVERFDDATKLFDYGFSNYKLVSIDFPPESLPPVNITGAAESKVQVDTRSEQEIIVKKGEEKKIKSEIILPKEMNAPIKAGQKLGKIVHKIGDNVLTEYPITATKNVGELSFTLAFLLLLRNFVSM
ncbi:MAG: D-alanyl-D-alanine carboxypeptidase [Oscillospiraceae bacterium]|jgi:D-alanyl-D-alanine carboxypeptidase (penicillin-binding protein 5/6)|nr:D-alanyl-D-alanine carboxypeptidase [Oscillospiraceae bacterium]